MARRRKRVTGLSEDGPLVESLELVREQGVDGSRYPYSIPALRGLERLELHPEVTFLVGENGSGKSTLIEAIAVAAGFNAEGGSRNFEFSTRRSHSELHRCLRLSRTARKIRTGFFLRAESFYNVASEVDQLGAEVRRAYGGVSLHAMSHGESFLALVKHRFGRDGFYVLDEPEAALSPSRQLSLLAAMHDLTARQRSQFVIATHSPILMAFPRATIYQLTPDGPTPIDYAETEHYQLTRDFLADPQRYLRYLFAD